MPSTDWQLRLRVFLALGTVVAINVLFVAVLGWAGVRLLSAGGVVSVSDAGIPLLVGSLLFGALGLVVIQARYGYRTALRSVDPTRIDGDGPRELSERVRRLAARADVPAPAVAVADRDDPNCFTVGGVGETTIVLTTGLLDRLDDDELDAVLAHEIAHIANRDVPVATTVAALSVSGERLLGRERTIREIMSLLWIIGVFGGLSMLIVIGPLAILLLVYLLVSLVARLVLGANAVTVGLYANVREFAADRYAATLTGNPSALASALETLDGDVPDRDARLRASAALGIVSRPVAYVTAEPTGERAHWIHEWMPDERMFEGPDWEHESEADDEDDRSPTPTVSERLGQRLREVAVEPVTWWLRAYVVDPVVGTVRAALAWRPSTHPPTQARIARLSAMAAEFERRSR